MTDEKKLARNVDLMISAELVKQLYDELIAAGFDSHVAIDYITSLVIKSSNKSGDNKNAERKDKT